MKALLFSFFLLLVGGAARATSDSLFHFIKQYTDEDGLPQNSIKSMAVGTEGYLWAATESGLVRFDGYNIRHYSADQLGVHSNRFSGILPQLRSACLVALNEKEEVVMLNGERAAPDKNYNAQLRKVLAFIPGLPDFSRFPQTGLPGCSKDIRTIGDTSILVYDYNTVFLWNTTTVSCWRNGQLVFAVPFHKGETTRFFMLNNSLCYLGNDRYLYQFGTDGLKKSPVTGLGGNGTTTRLRLYWNVGFREVVVAGDRALFRLEVKNSGVVARKLIDHFDAEENEIISIWLDWKQGRLLLGSQTKGLYVFSRPFFITSFPKQVKSLDNVYYAQTKWGRTGILTGQGNVFDITTPSERTVLPSLRARSDKYSILADESGRVWAKNGHTLYTTSTKMPGDTFSWSFPSFVETLSRSRTNHLLIGLSDGKVMQLNMHGRKNQPTLFFKVPGSITWLDPQNDTLIWVGTIAGAYRVNPVAKTYEAVPGLHKKHVRSIYRTRTGEVWFTTYGNGYFLYRNNVLTALPADRHNYLKTAHCMLEDNKGFLWITTNKGLFQVRKESLLKYAADSTTEVYYHYYSVKQGLATNEFNGGCQPCGLQLENNLFSFPSIQGLLWFYPEKIVPDLPAAGIFIDKMLIDGQDIPVKDTIQLPADMSQLKLLVSSPYWGNPDNVHIRYSIGGKDEKPVMLPVERQEIQLSKLPPGIFRLTIRKTTGFSLNDYKEKILYLTIPAPWYMHTFAFITYLACLVLLFLLIFKWRIRYIQKKNRLLEAKVAEQTAELNQTLNSLQESQQALLQRTQWQMKMLKVLGHDFRAPLNYLMLTTERIGNGLEKEGASSFIPASKTVSNYVRRLYHNMNNILQYIKSDLLKEEATMAYFDLSKLAEEKTAIFAEIAANAATIIEQKISYPFQVYSNRTLLSVIIHNLLDNAVKVTEEGQIFIEAKYEEGMAIVIVTDTGIGMSAPLSSWLNDPYTPGEAHSMQAGSGSGIGLEIVKELAALLNIRIHATQAEKGTSIALYIPRPSAPEK